MEAGPVTREEFEALAHPEPMSGCWLWMGAVNGDGYGRVWVKTARNRTPRANRTAWSLYRGPIAAGLSVLHRCDNRLCVNPDHLFLGTQADNMRDMAKKGRSTQGSRHPAAILCEGDINPIRARLAAGQSAREIAADYGVSGAVIYAINARRRWNHVPG